MYGDYAGDKPHLQHSGCTSKILNFCRNSFTSVALGLIKLDFLVLGILIRRTLPKVLLGFVAFRVKLGIPISMIVSEQATGMKTGKNE
jgi:hypothetical protein